MIEILSSALVFSLMIATAAYVMLFADRLDRLKAQAEIELAKKELKDALDKLSAVHNEAQLRYSDLSAKYDQLSTKVSAMAANQSAAGYRK